ncbi:hypothetical protein [Ferruginibacter profundus]|nr:hypothetical protein [Bacteroidota bacterium]
MRDALKNLFSNQITLEDNSQFYYTIKPYELTNALGNVIAVLQEYNFTKEGDNTGQFSCILYKTTEGNWYDVAETNKIIDNSVIMALKLAVDTHELAH